MKEFQWEVGDKAYTIVQNTVGREGNKIDTGAPASKVAAACGAAV